MDNFHIAHKGGGAEIFKNKLKDCIPINTIKFNIAIIN
jgi:hypothetical protein